ncbi:hypothetical protein DAPPUDRAFT_118191 [Daphnia pulex]|uniref:Uncharacterized protein n=1 Tax=Daphnia pulex TaxID=6669 RepID=E9HV08_DAPPU|nr:hypothetical protein DAPPUDRAFT_118191 [Daphnia pulex]|eukprot:EFX64419.1 hypothetical protein DAPPUDRAFT_118191 [Daphnia pulex]
MSTTHHCIKLEKDVLLCLLHIDEVPRPLLRIAEDGITDIAIKANDLLSRELGALTHVTVSVLVAIIHGEIDRLLVNSIHTQPKGLLQSVKALVSSVEWPFVLCRVIKSCSYCLRSKESGVSDP